MTLGHHKHSFQLLLIQTAALQCGEKAFQNHISQCCVLLANFDFWTHIFYPMHGSFHRRSGSVGSKAQGGPPASGVYGSPVNPVVSQGSSSYSHSSTATTPAPYSSDTSTDYSQYNQAYSQVLLPTNTHIGWTDNAFKYADRWVCLVTIVLLNLNLCKWGMKWTDDRKSVYGGVQWQWAVTRGSREVEEMKMLWIFGQTEWEWIWQWALCASICPCSPPFSTLHSKQVMKPSYWLFVCPSLLFISVLSLSFSLHLPCLPQQQVTYLIFCSKKKTQF